MTSTTTTALDPGELMTVGELLRVQSERRGDAPAFATASVRISYSELEHETVVLAGGFTELGIAEGDRVAIMMSNRAEYVLSWLALARIGATTVGLNTGYRGPSLASLLSLF